MPNYWAFVANPKYYRIEAVIQELDQDTRITKVSNISKALIHLEYWFWLEEDVA